MDNGDKSQYVCFLNCFILVFADAVSQLAMLPIWFMIGVCACSITFSHRVTDSKLCLASSWLQYQPSCRTPGGLRMECATPFMQSTFRPKMCKHEIAPKRSTIWSTSTSWFVTLEEINVTQSTYIYIDSIYLFIYYIKSSELLRRFLLPLSEFGCVGRGNSGGLHLLRSG